MCLNCNISRLDYFRREHLYPEFPAVRLKAVPEVKGSQCELRTAVRQASLSEAEHQSAAEPELPFQSESGLYSSLYCSCSGICTCTCCCTSICLSFGI